MPTICYYLKIILSALLMLVCFCAPATETRKSASVNTNDQLFMEIREADSVVFFWEAPQWDPDSVQYYQIFYQSVNGTSWSLLKDSVAPMANPEIAIYRTEIPSSDSLFVFSVRYVTASGALSPLHFSADSTAIPAGGWFMFWKAK